MANINPKGPGNGGSQYGRDPSPPTSPGQTTHVSHANEPLHTEHLEHKVTELYHQLESLVETQLHLAKTELSEKIGQVKKGAGTISVGGALAFYGGMALLAGLVLLLNTWIETLWISALIMGAVVALVGLIMIKGGKKAMEPANLKPERTMRSFKEDKEALKRRTR
jgi:uncharacterized membrane protein YqjE